MVPSNFDCSRFITGSNGVIKTLNIETGLEENRLPIPGYQESAIFTPCGKYFFDSDHYKAVICYETATGKVSHVFNIDDSQNQIFFKNGDKIYDYENCREIKFILEESNCTAYSHNGKFVVSGQGDRYSGFSHSETTLQMYNAETGEKIKLFPRLRDPILSAAFSPDDKYVVSGSAHWQILLWNAETGDVVRRYRGHKGPIREIAFTPDGKWIISCAEDKTIRLWTPGMPGVCGQFMASIH
jgi:WD40 repeat protein